MHSRRWLFVAAGYGFMMIVIVTMIIVEDGGSGPSGWMAFITWLSGMVLLVFLYVQWLPFRYTADQAQMGISADSGMAATNQVAAPPQRAEATAVQLPPTPSPPGLSSDVQEATPAVPPVVRQPAGDLAPAGYGARPDARGLSSAVFISHAKEDGEVAKQLARMLEEAFIPVWLASRDIAVGANYAQEITGQLTRAAVVIVLLSDAGINSPHVRREVTLAIDRDRPLLPVDVSGQPGFVATHPDDWSYWLSLAQVLPYADTDRTGAELARRIKALG